MAQPFAVPTAMHIEQLIYRRTEGVAHRTHRIVMDHGRDGGGRRRTVVYLGVGFSVPPRQWKMLCYMVHRKLAPDEMPLEFEDEELAAVADAIARRFRKKWAADLRIAA